MIDNKINNLIIEKQEKIVFLILNYETYWETNKCVNSIFETIGQHEISSLKHEIVIVDNGSTNNSLLKLHDYYDAVDGIHILKTEENLGFAKGNNLGFIYAKKFLAPDFIVMINNDIIMLDSDFEKKLIIEYKKYEFSIAGPDVMLPNGISLNPCFSSLKRPQDVKKKICELKKRVMLCKIGIEPIYAAWIRIKRKFEKNRNKWDGNARLNLSDGFQLHGCFIIFSNKYICKFNGIYDKTFLYGEESLLRLRCLRAEMKMCFLNDIKALHNESKTEKFICKHTNQRHLKKFNNMLDALGHIYKYMMSDEV